MHLLLPVDWASKAWIFSIHLSTAVALYSYRAATHAADGDEWRMAHLSSDRCNCRSDRSVLYAKKYEEFIDFIARGSILFLQRASRTDDLRSWKTSSLRLQKIANELDNQVISEQKNYLNF